MLRFKVVFGSVSGIISSLFVGNSSMLYAQSCLSIDLYKNVTQKYLLFYLKELTWLLDVLN